jgi:hypothetical protein
MHQGDRPRKLRDISHLYLSTSNAKEEKSRSFTALVLLASIGGSPLRAYLASGLTAAFGSHGTAVDLLETGEGQPCAGYYFALDPRVYLRPVIDSNLTVEHQEPGGARILYAKAPSLLRASSEAIPHSPRVILLAFDWPESAGSGGLRGVLDAVPALNGEGGWRDYPAFLLKASLSRDRWSNGLSQEFAELFPGGSSLSLFPGGGEDQPGDGAKECPFPADMLEGLSRRSQPSSLFLSGLAGEVLQKLGTRKKGALHDGGG